MTNNQSYTTINNIKNGWINSPYQFVVKFVIGFSALYLFFPFYRGLVGEGGGMYCAFLDEHLNMVKGLTALLTTSSRYILEWAGYHLNQTDYHTLRIEHSRGIDVNPSCLGWAVMSFWVAFVAANEGTLQRKLKWIVTGVGSIIVLNISRIALITLASHQNWSPVTSLDHHLAFNVVSYACIIILVCIYVSIQKYESDYRPRKETARTTAAV